MARTLLENYSGVHLREGRTLGGGTQGNTTRPPWGRRKGTSKGPSGKSSGKGFTRRAYPAIEEKEEYDGEEECLEEESYSYYPEAYPAMEGHDDDNDPDQDPDEVDSSEATSLNAMEELEDSSENETCHPAYAGC